MLYLILPASTALARTFLIKIIRILHNINSISITINVMLYYFPSNYRKWSNKYSTQNNIIDNNLITNCQVDCKIILMCTVVYAAFNVI